MRTAGQPPRDHDPWLSWTTTVKPGMCALCFLPRDVMHSADYAVARCLSVCPSHAGILSQQFSVSPQSSI